jgi:hypothetical protein
LHVFAYLKKHGWSKLVFGDSKDKFHPVDWTAFYGDAKEPIPPNALEQRWNEVQLNTLCDAG